MDVLTVVFSGIAALAAILGVILNMRLFNFNLAKSLPTAGLVEIRKFPAYPNVYRCCVRLQNNDNVPWLIKDLSLATPPKGLVCLHETINTGELDDYGDLVNIKISDIDLTKLTNCCPLSHELAPNQEQNHPILGSPFSHEVDFWVFLHKSPPAESISIRFSLASTDLIKRHRTKPLNITLSDATISTND